MDTAAETPKPSFLRRALRTTGRVILTLGFVGAALAAGTAGYGVLSARTGGGPELAPAPQTTVAPQVLTMQSHVVLERRFTGQFEPAQEVDLGFEEGGTLAEVAVQEGETVARGDVIARLDTRLLEAERAQAEAARNALTAQVELARRTNIRAEQLLTEGHVTQQRVDETSLRLAELEAALGEVDARMTALDVRLSKAVIRAPFAARVGHRFLDEGAVAGPGSPVVSLLEDAPARFRVAIDPDMSDMLAIGDVVEIDVAGDRVPARLTELAPDLDPATRSRLAFFDVEHEGQTPLSRVTGDVVLEAQHTSEGAWVPLAALRQGPRGSWTVLTVEPGVEGTGTIGIEAAEVLHVDGPMAFLRGTFTDGELILPAGTHRVVPGELVLIAEAE